MRGSGSPELAPRVERACVVLLLVLQTVLVVDVARRTGCTVDEHHYFNSGQVLARHGFAHVATTLQGPLPLRANQLLVGRFPPGGFHAAEGHGQKLLFRGRLPTLLFVLPASVLLYWARRSWGAAGALLTLTFLCLHPLWLAYSGLLLVDAQHASVLLFALFLLARQLERPGPWRLAAFAAAGAAAVATKYLALLALGPAAFLALAASAGAAPRGRRVRAALGALAVLLASGLLTLHACYGFGAVPHEPETFRSGTLRALSGVPVGRAVLACLPAPFLQGLDYQRAQGERTWRFFLDGELLPGSARYFALVFLRRTPELLLVLAPFALALARRARRRTDLLALGLPLGALAAYLSFGTSMQLGVRYALVFVPASCFVLGSIGTWRVLARRAWAAPAAAALCAAWLGSDLVRNGPDWLGYFNRCSGGQARAYRHFRDTNSDFGQHQERVAQWLASTDPSATRLDKKSGAFFGRVAVRMVWTRLGRAPRTTLDWAVVGEPRAHLGAAWYVFEVTPEGLRERVEREGRADLRRSLAIAYLVAGERAEAARVAAPLALARSDPLRRLFAAPDPGAPALAPAWTAIGHPERDATRARGDDPSPNAWPGGRPLPDGPRVRAACAHRREVERYLALLD